MSTGEHRCVIGIDGGGTKTVAVVADLDGKELGRGTAGPCSVSALSPDEAFANVEAAFRAALAEAARSVDDVAAVCAGVAGWSVAGKRDAFTRLLASAFPAAEATVDPDYAVALTGALGGEPGIVVVAGTGSIAYGENADGKSMRTGGYGYLIDDAGSGYGVGRLAIAAILKAADGRGSETGLTQAVLEATGLALPAELGAAVYDGRISRTDIASLAAVVAAQAALYDQIATKILFDAAWELALLVNPIVRELFYDVESAQIARVGSLWQAGPPLNDAFRMALEGIEPPLELIEPHFSPEYGAVLRALQAIGRR